jgi:hypothetical protein
MIKDLSTRTSAFTASTGELLYGVLILQLILVQAGLCLTDMALPKSTMAVSLVSSNLGVEAGQLAIVATFCPWPIRCAVLGFIPASSSCPARYASR